MYKTEYSTEACRGFVPDRLYLSKVTHADHVQMHRSEPVPSAPAPEDMELPRSFNPLIWIMNH